MPLTRRKEKKKKRKGRERAIDEQTLKVDCPAAIFPLFSRAVVSFFPLSSFFPPPCVGITKRKARRKEKRRKGFFWLDWSLGWMPFSPSLFPNAAGRKKRGGGRGGNFAKKHELALSVLPLLFLSLAAFLFLFCLANSAMHTQAKKRGGRTFSSLIGRTNICQKECSQEDEEEEGGGRISAHIEE